MDSAPLSGATVGLANRCPSPAKSFEFHLAFLVSTVMSMADYANDPRTAIHTRDSASSECAASLDWTGSFQSQRSIFRPKWGRSTVLGLLKPLMHGLI